MRAGQRGLGPRASRTKSLSGLTFGVARVYKSAPRCGLYMDRLREPIGLLNLNQTCVWYIQIR